MDTTLPGSYQQRGTLNFSTSKALILGLMIVGSILFVLFGWIFVRAVIAMRPAAAEWLVLWSYSAEDSDGFSFGFSFAYIIGAVVAIPLVVVLHEAVHGIAFWAFTRQRPRFGWKGWFVYTAAPEGAYLARNPYIVVTLAPLVVLTVLGLGIAPLLPLSVLSTLICFLRLTLLVPLVICS